MEDADAPQSSETVVLGESDESGMRFNFKDASLDVVLDYMSRAAGFTIIRETSISGRVDIVSHQPISRDEAVELLNTVLHQKGYAAIRNGRILTIVSRDEALKRNIPVKTGRNPESIPQNDEMVTQIIPVRYANAVKIIDNIRPMLPSYAVVSANESSNAVILTDTQSHIRRMTEIIAALDTSISEISSIKVFVLKYTDSTDVAKILTEIFKFPDGGRQQSAGGGRFPFFGRRSPGEGEDSSQSQNKSEALQAASRVVAVADQNTNSVVVSAPEDFMPAIERLVNEIDTASQDVTIVKVFPLRYASAEETATIIKNTFAGSTAGGQSRTNQRWGFMRNMAQGGNQQNQSERKRAEGTVYVEADSRTNSVVVSASENVMANIETVIQQLDANPAREKKVYIHNIKNADPESVTKLLNEMFGSQTSQSSTTTRNTGRSAGTNTSNSAAAGSSTRRPGTTGRTR
jgi:general secretion pathway protein D